ncbi:3-oxoadipate enol-lactonase [Terrihabitans soli]|uniref:3-oxoadipate enol-lactonase n=1 Tax=Terrihabitans soli TaxID=708113 RepID=A0A6S6QM07_9HYPH|nr:alpha/beta fold hydrolase [Terrihabitans soli]BCJ89949.1 3-oxoadipate enol-lactonase [Terrihabitans soli]
MTEKLHFTVSGRGPHLVLAHSLASNSDLWSAQLPLLEKHFTVLRFDIRGHGRSPAPAGAYTMEELADDAIALLEGQGIKKVTWVAVSLGAMIGQVVALKKPDLIEKLVLADTTSGYPPPAQAAWNERIEHVEHDGMNGVVNGTLSRWFTEGFQTKHPDKFGRIREMILATNPAGFIGCGNAIRDFDVKSETHRISCPTLVMVGEHDQATPPDMARGIAASIPGAKFVLIPDAAHQAAVEQPSFFNAELAKFLNLVEAP